MSPFEIIMLTCFGAAWPLAIYKSWRSRRTGGKSWPFLAVIAFGYLCGILHKAFYNYDGVIYLYALNLVLVLTDLGLYVRNRRLEKDLADGCEDD